MNDLMLIAAAKSSAMRNSRPSTRRRDGDLDPIAHRAALPCGPQPKSWRRVSFISRESLAISHGQGDAYGDRFFGLVEMHDEARPTITSSLD